MSTQIESKPDSKFGSDSLLRSPSLEFYREIRSAIMHVAKDPGIGERDLTRRLFLHLPRFSMEELNDSTLIRSEAERLAAQIERKRRDYRFLENRPKIQSLIRGDFELRECSPRIARVIHKSFHYLASYHEGVVHLGLFEKDDTEFPMALASLSPMDIRRLYTTFPTSEVRKKILVLSRVFAFDWAPRNTISYLLSNVDGWLRRNIPEIKSLLTFLNPNLGFSGASLRASNWNTFLELEPVSSYIRGNYVPYRLMLGLPDNLRQRVSSSLQAQRPLKVLRYDLVRRENLIERSEFIGT
jgi:hypothetical protein